MAHEVTLIPGDGTGPELIDATRRVLEATGVEFEWDEHPAGEDVYKMKRAVKFPFLDYSTLARRHAACVSPSVPSRGSSAASSVSSRSVLTSSGIGCFSPASWPRTIS